jgi:hypothetical protein
MADDAHRSEQPFLYDAFISYRHVDRDRKWAEWLIDALESYRVPKSLQHRGLPARLHRVFRDEDEVPASSDLNDQIRNALIASRFLIVVCSAFTPRSKWVEREIQIFNELGRGDQVLALLTEGEPGDSFPSAMLVRERQVVQPDGSTHIVKEDKEPLAADVRPRSGVSKEKLKRFALLRLVAVILGVKFDELRQRDHERERHGRLVWGAAAAVLCLLLGGLGLLYWDLMRPSTVHYRQIVWRWGVPEGLGPVDEDTRRHRAINYSVTTQRSSIMASPRVVEARRENSAGKLSVLNSQRNDNDERVHWVIRYREDESAERIVGFDATDRLLREDVLRREPSSNRIIVTFERDNIPVAQNANQNMIIDPLNVARSNLTEGRTEITRQELTFDSNGFVVGRHFQDSWGTPRHDAEGSFGEHFANSPEGLVVRSAEIDAAGTEITLKNGVRAVEALYDRDYNLARYTLIGIDERPIDGPNGFANYVRQFDRWGNDLTTTNYHPDGKPALHKDGYAKYTVAYDDRGFQTELAYVGVDGKPTLTKNGYASFKRANDDRGQPIEESFFGVDGKPTLIKDGYSKAKTSYDAHGHVIEAAFFDVDNNRTLYSYGEAIVRQAFDQRGNIVEKSYFGIDGKSTLINDGYSSFREAYDGHDNLTEETYYGVDGKPILHKNGFAAVRQAFDQRGNLVARSFFDLGGKPVLNREGGNAKFTQVYDDRGNLIEIDFFGIDGKPILRKDGYASFRTVYDDRGNIIENDFFGVDGKPTLHKDGYARAKFTHDARGNIVDISFYGVDGRPRNGIENFASGHLVYDAQGNMIEITYFGENGKPAVLVAAKIVKGFDARGNNTEFAVFGADGKSALSPGSFAKFAAHFDTQNNETERAFFGSDGKPILLWDGYAKWTKMYDPRGNVIDLAYFGIDGKPTGIRSGYARITYNYDARANETKTAYFGIDGKPIVNKDGYASVSHEYDTRGNETERVLFGIDGKPIVAKDGYAKIVYEYDNLGHEIHARYLDIQNHEIPMEIVILNILHPSTGERIGLKAGDRILTYNGHTLTSIRQFKDQITDATGAASRLLVIRRGSQNLSFEVASGRLGINIEMARAESEREVDPPRAQPN